MNGSGRAYRYRMLYRVDFTTNEGETDQGRVIYSVQSTHRAQTTPDKVYCEAQSHKFASCMFSKVTVCYAHKYISQNPTWRRVDWSQVFGYLSRMAQARRQNPSQVEGAYEVIRFCDPRPPNSGAR